CNGTLTMARCRRSTTNDCRECYIQLIGIRRRSYFRWISTSSGAVFRSRKAGLILRSIPNRARAGRLRRFRKSTPPTIRLSSSALRRLSRRRAYSSWAAALFLYGRAVLLGVAWDRQAVRASARPEGCLARGGASDGDRLSGRERRGKN